MISTYMLLEPTGYQQVINKAVKWLNNNFRLRSMLTKVQQDRITVKSDLKLQNQVQDWFEAFCLRYLVQEGWSESQIYRMNLALAEGFTNAVRHAHRTLPPETNIEIELGLWVDRLEIRIWDYGQPFNPDQIPEPQPGTLQDHGYGWFLIRRLSDYVVYERADNERNCLLIVKNHF